MARILSILVGLFFTVALAWSFGKGAYTAITEPAVPTAEHEFHEHPKALHLASDGPFGKFDKQQTSAASRSTRKSVQPATR